MNELLLPVKMGSGFLGVDLLLTSMWPSQVTFSKHLRTAMLRNQ